MSLYHELKRRNVFRVGAAYVVAAWLLIQVAETIFPLFGFDDTPARIVVVVLAIGFIPSVILAWAFELTPEGLKKDKRDRSRRYLYSFCDFRGYWYLAGQSCMYDHWHLR